MTVQFYHKDAEPTAKIFDSARNGRAFLAELHLVGRKESDADAGLHGIRMARRHPWIDYGHMLQAQVRFYRPRKTVQPNRKTKRRTR